jgi:hypothetical protein
MKERIEVVFEALKELDMKPTPGNVSIMNGVYEQLRAVYNELKEGEENAESRATSDSE